MKLALRAGLAVCALGVAALSAGTAQAAGPCGTAKTAPSYQHVIWIWEENHSYDTIIGSSQAPYINKVAKKCGLATNYHNITHPSLPNYIAATSGLSALGPFVSDCNPVSPCTTAARNIFGQTGRWKAYEEQMPSNCDKTTSGPYAVRHNPPAYYSKLSSCGTKDVPYTHLAKDLSSGKLPAFSFITPNLIDDMHDGTVAQGDSWLKVNLPKILNSKEYKAHTVVVFITWDEGEGGMAAAGENCATNPTDVSCHVATIVISPSTKPGTKSATLFNHYSLLRTTEQLLGLRPIGSARTATSMLRPFKL